MQFRKVLTGKDSEIRLNKEGKNISFAIFLDKSSISLPNQYSNEGTSAVN